MSGPVVENKLVAPALQPATDRGAAGQRQQWRLIFEKAYLALSRHDPSSARNEKTAVAAAADNSRAVALIPEHEPEPAAPGGAVSGALMCVYGADGDPAELAVQLTGAAVERGITEFPGGREVLLPAQARAEVKAVSPARAAGRPELHNAPIPEKSLLLLLSEDGLQLVIRDAAAGADLINRIIPRVREILDSRGMRLARVILNGMELWKEGTEGSEPEAGGHARVASDLINRIY